MILYLVSFSFQIFILDHTPISYTLRMPFGLREVRWDFLELIKARILFYEILERIWDVIINLENVFANNGDRFGSIGHNGASRVSKFTEKTDQLYYFMLW